MAGASRKSATVVVRRLGATQAIAGFRCSFCATRILPGVPHKQGQDLPPCRRLGKWGGLNALTSSLCSAISMSAGRRHGVLQSKVGCRVSGNMFCAESISAILVPGQLQDGTRIYIMHMGMDWVGWLAGLGSALRACSCMMASSEACREPVVHEGP